MNLGFFIILTFVLILCEATKVSSDLRTHDDYIQHEQEWKQYKAKHKKQYSREEDLKRKQKYMQKKSLIDSHNAAYKQGKVTYEMKANQWTDQDPEEYKHLKGFIYHEGALRNSRRMSKILSLNSSLPDSVDWRHAVTEVRDQGRCGSCWAFSAAGAIEVQYYLKYKKKLLLSEQELIDCSSQDAGCEGGMYTTAFDYMKDNVGLSSEIDYPYKIKKGVCLGGRSVKFGISTYDILQSEDDMKYYVAEYGPISVAIKVTDNLQHYSTGIFNDPLCTNKVDHAVLIVGYGTSDGVDYWLVKNSWGTNWGDQGYFKIIRNKNHCGIATIPVFPKITSAAISTPALMGLPIIISILNIILNHLF